MEIVNKESLLEQLDAFIQDSDRRMASFFEKTGWNPRAQQRSDKEMCTCPHDSGHQVPKNALEEHVEKCAWRKNGYHEKDIPLPSSGHFYDKADVPCVKIDSATMGNILCNVPGSSRANTESVGNQDNMPIPMTAERLSADYNPAERLAIYDYVCKNTREKMQSSIKLEELQISFNTKKTNKSKTFYETLAEQRDAKRRRVTHKGKKVHTNRKTHTEILREVIQCQMETLTESVQQNETETYPVQKEKYDSYTYGNERAYHNKWKNDAYFNSHRRQSDERKQSDGRNRSYQKHDSHYHKYDKHRGSYRQ